MTNPCKDCGKAPRRPGRSYCKPCESKRHRKYYKANRVQRLAYYEEHRDDYRVNKQQYNAKKRGFEVLEKVDIEVVFFRDKGICHVCVEPVDMSLERGRHPMSATLDHLEPIHSYDTVRLAHLRCNQQRQNEAS